MPQPQRLRARGRPGPPVGAAHEWEEAFWRLSPAWLAEGHVFWVWGPGSDLGSAACATCPSGTSFRAVLAAPRRRLHLPGVPLSGEAAAPRAQELCADSPAGNSASTADLRAQAVRGVGEGCGGFSRNPQMRGRASAPVWAHLGPRKDRPAAPQATRISFFSHVHTHP